MTWRTSYDEVNSLDDDDDYDDDSLPELALTYRTG